MWAWMCPRVGTQGNGANPGVCFILSGLCLLLPGAVECTALGGGCREGKQRRPASQLLFCLLVKEKADSVLPPLKRMSLKDEPCNTGSLTHIQSGLSVNMAMDHCPVGLHVDSPPFQPWVSLLPSPHPGLQPACSLNAPSAFSSSGSSRLPARPWSLLEVNPNSLTLRDSS